MNMTRGKESSPFFALCALGFAIRLVLIFYGAWQDANFAVKYTDIDYVVFSDAARHVSEGNSPYDRVTYRYTPLVAFLMLPNVLWHMCFGKIIFAALDIFVGFCLYAMSGMVSGSPGGRVGPRTRSLVASIYLFNPLAINISTRGNADVLIVAAVMGAVWLLLRRPISANGSFTPTLALSAALLGLGVHLKLYPVIFGPVFAFYFIHKTSSIWAGMRITVLYGITAVFFLAAPTVLLYRVYGYKFLYETYLYHFTRTDHRHNLSPFWLFVYLSEGSLATSVVYRVAPFALQIAIILLTSYCFYSDVVYAVFLLTWVFVTFNKVVTVQYFVWWLAFLPLALQRLRILQVGQGSRPAAMAKRFVLPTLFWVASIASWLYFGYQLEFRGLSSAYYPLSFAGVAFLLANALCIAVFIVSHPGAATA